jgi:hypothetical protein
MYGKTNRKKVIYAPTRQFEALLHKRSGKYHDMEQ